MTSDLKITFVLCHAKGYCTSELQCFDKEQYNLTVCYIFVHLRNIYIHLI